MLRRVCRNLRRDWAFTTVVVLSLALGIGANTAFFAAAYSLLVAPLPYPDSDRLVALHESQPRGNSGVALPNLRDWQSQTENFDSIAAGLPRTFGIRTNNIDDIVVVNVGMVTADFLRTLGVSTSLGRTFTSEEEMQRAPVAVITDRLWSQRQKKLRARCRL